MEMIYFPGNFGCFQWSNKEDKILYTAEKKYKKAVSFFTKPPKEEDKKDTVEPVSLLRLSAIFYIIYEWK